MNGRAQYVRLFTSREQVYVGGILWRAPGLCPRTILLHTSDLLQPVKCRALHLYVYADDTQMNGGLLPISLALFAMACLCALMTCL